MSSRQYAIALDSEVFSGATLVIAVTDTQEPFILLATEGLKL